MSDDRFAVLVNRGGGSADDGSDAVRGALAASGLDHRVFEVDGDPSDAARAAVADGFTVLVACGGDGSVGAVAAVAVDTGATLAVVPLGTLNHFARDLGVPDEPAGAVDVLATGMHRTVDVGCVGPTVFVNNASVGSYARLVARREELEDRMGKWTAALAAVRAVFPHRPVPVTLEVDGERIDLDATLVFFGNNEYVVTDGRFTRERLDEGVVSVYAMRAPHVWDLIRIGYRIARDRVAREQDLVHRTGTRIRLSTAGATVLLAHDGEVRSVEVPLDVVVRPGALTVLAPSVSEREPS